jgi:TP901 family phage tail tape measure protein
LTALTTAISKAELLQKSLTFKPKLDPGFLKKDIEETLKGIEQGFEEAGAKGVRTSRAQSAVEQPKDRRAGAVLDAQGREINRINADLENVASKVIDTFTKTIERRFTTNMEAVEARINAAFQKSLVNVGTFGGRSQNDLSQEAGERVAAARQRQVNQSNRVAPIIGLSTDDIRARTARTIQEQAERDNLAVDLRRSRQIVRAESDNEARDRIAGRTQLKAEIENEVRDRRLLSLQIRAELENELRDIKRARQITIAEQENRSSWPNRAGRQTLFDRATQPGFIAGQAAILGNYVAISSAYQAITGTISGVINLEKELKQFQAITQTSNTEMVTFEHGLLAIASSSKFTANEVAQAATIMGQAGLSAKQVGDSIQAVINLAAASGSGLKESVDVVTSVLGVFNLNASEAARVANVLTSGLNLSKLTIDKLALGVQYAGNVAHDAGLSFTELTATLGGLSNAGIRNGSTLGTGVRQVLLDLQNPSDKFKKVMQELGITLTDIDIKSNGLVGVFENLAKKGFTNADALRSFETRAIAAFSAISNNLDTIKSFKVRCC